MVGPFLPEATFQPPLIGGRQRRTRRFLGVRQQLLVQTPLLLGGKILLVLRELRLRQTAILALVFTVMIPLRNRNFALLAAATCLDLPLGHRPQKGTEAPLLCIVTAQASKVPLYEREPHLLKDVVDIGPVHSVTP